MDKQDQQRQRREEESRDAERHPANNRMHASGEEEHPRRKQDRREQGREHPPYNTAESALSPLGHAAG